MLVNTILFHCDRAHRNVWLEMCLSSPSKCVERNAATKQDNTDKKPCTYLLKSLTKSEGVE